MINYSYAQTLQFLLDAVALKGEDYVYEGVESGRDAMRCHYARNGAPDCIVGHVLARLGVPVEKMEYNPGTKDHVDMISYRTIAHHFDNLRSEYGINFSERAQHLLYLTQGFQDSDEPWGNAVQFAKDDIESE